MQKEETPAKAAGTTSGAKVSVGKSMLAPFASVKLTVSLITLIAVTVLIGAWCPQESQVGQEKVIEMFGEQIGLNMIQWGIADIFHSPWFLGLIGLLTVNMIACSVQRVFPKIRLLKLPMPWLGAQEISRMPWHESIAFTPRTGEPNMLDLLAQRLKRQGYAVSRKDDRMTAEFGKFGRLAPTVTHIGLLSLLLGVTITSWTGFSGFKPVRLGDDLSFTDSEHSKLWIGKLPKWHVHVDATRRENYPTGEAKQWYSDLRVVDEQGRQLSKQQISVNNPLTYQSVDVYQSSWGLDSAVVEFNGNKRQLQLRAMGKINAAFLPLDESTVLIFSVSDQTKPLRLFAKRPEWQAPKMLGQVPIGKSIHLGSVELKYDGVIPITGLQYKCDPGLPITYVAFGFIILGVMLATVPHRHVWASMAVVASEDAAPPLAVLSVGGRSIKAKVGFERSMQKLMQTLGKTQDCGSAEPASTENDAPAGLSSTDAAADETKQFALAQNNNEVS